METLVICTQIGVFGPPPTTRSEQLLNATSQAALELIRERRIHLGCPDRASDRQCVGHRRRQATSSDTR